MHIIFENPKRQTYAQKQQEQVGTDEAEVNSCISPSIVKFKAETTVKLVSDFVSTVFTGTGCVIDQVPRTQFLKERSHVFSTCLASGCIEQIKFGCSTNNGPVVKFGCHHSANEACERIQLVQPNSPEFRD